MTWTKLSDDFGQDCARANLTDAAFRLHVEALIWAMFKLNGGRITLLDLRKFAETADPELDAAELVAAGFWVALSETSWQVVHHMIHQLEPDVVDAQRAAAAERKRRQRRKNAGLPPAPDADVTPGVTRDMARDVPRDPGRVGSGRDGTKPTAKPALKRSRSSRRGCGNRNKSAGTTTTRSPEPATTSSGSYADGTPHSDSTKTTGETKSWPDSKTATGSSRSRRSGC